MIRSWILEVLIPSVALTAVPVAIVASCSSPQQTIRTALPVARALVELAEAVCVATDSAESCLTKCQIEAQRRSAERVIEEAAK